MSSAAQPTPETDEKKSRGLGSYLLWAFVAVMVYVLSSGAVLRYGPHGLGYYITDGTLLNNPEVTVVYAPLWWLYHNTFFHKPLGVYWHFWRADEFDSQGEFTPYRGFPGPRVGA
jgi:hypothetical protein